MPALAHTDVTIDRERDVVAINAWFQRWGARVRCTDHRGCGCGCGCGCDRAA